MIPSEAPVVRVGDQDFILRFTVPRVREMEIRSGKTLTQMAAGLVQLSLDSATWMFWAAVAHPDNPAYKDAAPPSPVGTKPSALESLLNLQDFQPVVNGLTAAFKQAFPQFYEKPVNPQLPTVQ